MQDKFIYLDNNATTQIDPNVLEAMMPYLTEQFANPSSSHPLGKKAKQAVDHSNAVIAEALNCSPKEIYFTSGATEALNMALKGMALANTDRKNHIITVRSEHKAVLDVCDYLETIGFNITYLNVNNDGLVDLKQLEDAITSDTLLVSVMMANNETGVIQSISDIGKITKKRGVIFLSDITQALGKVPVHLQENNIDIAVFSGHKLYGPKGIGGIYINSNIDNIIPLIHGGGHQNNLRSGTLNAAGIVGLGKAFELIPDSLRVYKRIENLRNDLENQLINSIGLKINGIGAIRLPNTSNVYIQGINGDSLLNELYFKNICVSQASACSSALMEPSHVLKAMGLNDREAFSSIRISLGKFNKFDEIQQTVETIKNAVHYLRN